MSSIIDDTGVTAVGVVDAVKPAITKSPGTGEKRGEGAIPPIVGTVPQDETPEVLTNWERRRDEAIGKITAIEKSLSESNGTADKILDRIDHALGLAITIAQIAAARGDVTLAETIAARADRLVSQAPAAANAAGNGILASSGNNLDAIQRKYNALKHRIDTIVAKAQSFVTLVATARRVAEVTAPSRTAEHISRTAEALVNAVGPLIIEESPKPVRAYRPTDITS